MSSERQKISPAEMVYHARRRIAAIQLWTRQDTEDSYLANDERQAVNRRTKMTPRIASGRIVTLGVGIIMR